LQNQPAAPAAPSAPGAVTPQAPKAPQVIVPVEPSRPQVTTPEVQPPQTVPAPVVVVPVVPPQPEQPQTQPAPAPEQPQAPLVPPPTVVIVPPAPEAATPEKKDATPLTPESFLLSSPEPEKKPESKPEEKPAQAEKKPEKPPKEPKKPEKAEAPKKGDFLKIPEEAKKTGKLDFLEGCWVGTRPEYRTKRIITERFCFGKDGVGKRFIEDPGYAGRCVGATKALMNQGGTLRMQSEKMYCTDTSSNWGGSEMTCQGEGDQTPCTWIFTDSGGGRQSYSIRFVRE
jgi:hypothetical protein